MTPVSERWLLPDGVEETLPDEAWRIEQLRRRLIDRLYGCGYDLVMPPLVEYLESLLTGTGEDLSLQTFKVTDQLSGRMLGVRADMTPQVARIEAHFLQRSAPTRLCYAGSTLLARGVGPGASRELLQLGAELFGEAGAEADAEVIGLAVDCLRLAGVDAPSLDLGHVGVYRALSLEANLDAAAESELFDILQRKSVPDLERFLAAGVLQAEHAAWFRELIDMNGAADVIERALARFTLPGVRAALGNLREVVERVSALYPELPLYVDLGELRGYHYHTGTVFTLLVPGRGGAVAKGGRYDDIGDTFGRPRPATGFSCDLRELVRLDRSGASQPRLIAAPSPVEPGLRAEIERLRLAGHRVVASNGAAVLPAGCDDRLVARDGGWRVEPAAGENAS